MKTLQQTDFALVLLAAGNSSRLGQSKQLLSFGANSLISRQLDMMLSVSPHCYCVLGYNAKTLVEHLCAKPVHIIENTKWQQGLSSSISCATKHLQHRYHALCFILVDQYQLTQNQLNDFLLFSQLNKDKIIAASCSSKKEPLNKLMSPPIVFPNQFYQQLIVNDVGSGARNILEKNRNDLLLYNLPEAFIDIDTPEDLQNFNLWQQLQGFSAM